MVHFITAMPPVRVPETRLEKLAVSAAGLMLVGIYAAIYRILMGSWRSAVAPLAGLLVAMGASAAIYLPLKRTGRVPSAWWWAALPLAWGLGGWVADQIAPPPPDGPSSAALLASMGVMLSLLGWAGRRKRARK